MFLLRAALRNWRIMLLFGILGILAGALYIQFAPRIYMATTVVEMNVRRPRVINNDAVYEGLDTGRDTDAIFNTRFEKFKSPAMEKLATREFFKRYPESKSEDNPAGINKRTLPPLIREVRWRKDPDANIVRVSYACPYPRFAANLVNVLSDCAGILMQDENKAQSDEAVKWLVSQVEEQRESLEEFEKQLADIRQEVQLDSMQQRKAALGQVMTTVFEERETLVSKLEERENIHDFLSGLREEGSDLEVLPSGLPKEEQMNELLRVWQAAHDEFQQAAGRYTEMHPQYRLAEEKDARARKRLEQFIDNSVKAVQHEIDLLKLQVEQKDQRISDMKKEAVELEQALAVGMQRVQGLERKRDAADNAFQTMLRRMEEARAAADENMAFTKVIRTAAVPRIPVSPQKPTVLIICLFIAGMLGMAVSIVKELWTDSVASISDLRNLNLNVLGVVPSQKKLESRAELATIGLRDKFNPVVEVFAGVNALLSSEKYANQSKVLLLSSVMPGEGKTITACNLAISSAMNGFKTLLIDGDLRRPQMASIFAISPEHPSLLEWLSSGTSMLACHELVSKDVINNLDLIPSKSLSDTNPAELLGRGRLAELIAWAREEYDRVIIDSPPIGPVGDAQTLANFSDGVVLVARLEKTRRRLLRVALARFAEIDAHVLGCIANDVPHSLAGMFTGAEGYGYGYGSYSYKAYGRN